MVSSLRSRRIGLLAFAATCGLLGVSGTGLAQASGFLDLLPGEGSPGTSYEITVTCGEEPTLKGRPLDDDPPATLVPLELDQTGPSIWTATAVASELDDVYGAVCGEETDRARFDTDAPRLHLGPLPENFMDAGRPKTTIEGTDCPDGTTANVTLTVGDEVTTETAAVDSYGDWAVPLPAAAESLGLRVEATCGDVAYDPLVVTPTSGQPNPTTPTAPPAPTAGAPPAEPQAGRATYTG